MTSKDQEKGGVEAKAGNKEEAMEGAVGEIKDEPSKPSNVTNETDKFNRKEEAKEAKEATEKANETRATGGVGDRDNASPAVTRDAAPSTKQPSPPSSTRSDSDSPRQLESQSDAPDEFAADQYLTGIKLWMVLMAIVLVQFVVMLDISVVSTAIPYITDDFHSILNLGWYGCAYQLASASLQPLTGKIYTKLTPKWTFFAFFFVFELGSLLCGVAQSSVMLIVARAVAGLGSCGLLTGALTIVSACLPKDRQPIMLGLMVAIGQFGQACGPLLGGAFTEYVSWRWCFYINLPIGALISAFLFFVEIPDKIQRPDVRTLVRTLISSLDLLGFVLFAPAAIMLLLALQYGGNDFPWDSSVVIGLFCGAVATFAVFLCWEYRQGEAAMIPLSMVRQRIVWSSCATMFFNIGVTNCASYYLPVYFQGVKDASPIMSGVYLLPNIMLQITMALASGILIQRYGYYLPAVLIGAALSCVSFGLLSMLTPDYSVAKRVGYQILAGFGMGCVTTMPFLAVQNLIALPQIPVAMAILVFCQNLGGACFLAIAQTVFSQSLRADIQKYAPGVDISAILAAGVTGFRKIVSASELPGMLMAYSMSVDRVFYLVCGIAGASFVTGSCMGWKDMRKRDS